ncbi:MAG: hypothetical protein ACI83I_001646 [Bacteroidia bacterium]|jgi:hypothetical protein
MPDQFNYQKHLSGIIKPTLTSLGFRKKGSNFILEKNKNTFTISITRSRQNRRNTLQQLLFVFGAKINDYIIESFKIYRITNNTFPDYYSPFYKEELDWTVKSELLLNFSQEQTKEIDDYLNSQEWFYNNEEQLAQILNGINDQIIKVVLPVMDYALKIESKSSFAIRKELIDYKDALYLKQLTPEARFPKPK